MNPAESEWPKGVKKTKPRQYVLSVLEKARSPLSVLEIYHAIEKDGKSVWMSTVYRILELFVSKGLATKTTLMDSDMAIYALNRHQHKHYAVCLNCHKIIELENCPMDAFVPELDESGFHVVGHKVELYGYCQNCEKTKYPTQPKS